MKKCEKSLSDLDSNKPDIMRVPEKNKKRKGQSWPLKKSWPKIGKGNRHPDLGFPTGSNKINPRKSTKVHYNQIFRSSRQTIWEAQEKRDMSHTREYP